MEKNLNKLNDVWINAGHQVEDLNNEINIALQDDAIDVDKIKDLKAKRDNAKAKRDMLKDQLEEVRQAMVEEIDKQNEVKPKKDETTQPQSSHESNVRFANKFVAMVRGKLPQNDLTEISTDSGDTTVGGIVVPPDIQVQINYLIRQYQSLQQFVRVEATKVITGSRVWEQWKDITPLSELGGDDTLIANNDDPDLQTIKYNIHNYAGISTITNTLLKDSPDNLIAWIVRWAGHKSMVTRNIQILNALKQLPLQVTINDYSDIRTLINGTLDPALIPLSSLITNQSGFNILNNVTDGFGRYLIQPDVTQKNVYELSGRQVVVVSDRWLPDNADGTHPLIYGDLNETVALFDREQMSLLTTNVGAGAFKTNTTKIRLIDRFDVELLDQQAAVMTKFGDLPNNSGSTASTTQSSKASK